MTSQPTPNANVCPIIADTPILKQQYIDALASLCANGSSLRKIVTALIERGVPKRLLVDWAEEAGYSRSHIQSLLSRILCGAGQRERKPGAGRRVSAEALALLDYATTQFGENPAKHLRAAYRAAKAQQSPQALREKPNAQHWDTNKNLLIVNVATFSSEPPHANPPAFNLNSDRRPSCELPSTSSDEPVPDCGPQLAPDSSASNLPHANPQLS
jgi:hypothetical protein